MTSHPLPHWNLADLYPSPESEEWAADLKRLQQDAETFKTTYQGRTATLSGPELLKAIRAYEDLQELEGRLISYAYLLFAEDMSKPESGKLLQETREALTTANHDLIFFSLELNAIPSVSLKETIETTPDLAHYAPWLHTVRLYRDHQLSEELERLDQDRRLTSAAWIRLFDETLARLRFPWTSEEDTHELTLSELMNKMVDPEEKVREKASHTLANVFEIQEPLFVHITNTLAQDKMVTDRWRHYPTPMSARHLDNQVDEEVVEALASTVENHYKDLSHRYYRLKARWLGSETMPYWNRNAPLPDEPRTHISWSSAKNLVLDAYREFSPKMAAIGEMFFEKGWIDARLTPGKDSGAFAHPTVPSVHPYILLNYHGKLRDVMTLAHELGHGIHQFLASKQGMLLSDTPLTVAETASVFGEMLTFRSLLARTKTPAERRHLIASKVEDMLNTVVRQVAFYRFEQDVHLGRLKGELSAEDLRGFWLRRQQESLGDAIRLDPEYGIYWVYISHFIHAPFYVYAYAFGDCLVNALYGLYAEGYPDFTEKYLHLLSCGGSKTYDVLLEPFGLDPKDPTFWARGLKTIESLIDELEGLSPHHDR